MPETVLVTGGAGFVGTHVAADLLAAGCRVVVLDDFSNAAPDVLTRVAALGGGRLEAVRADVRDDACLDRLCRGYGFDGVVHLAGLKVAADSIAAPARYRAVNVGGMTALLRAVVRHRIGCVVFSSSAAVYGAQGQMPIDEEAVPAPATPYGRFKLLAERLLAEAAAAQPRLRAVALRYFNPVGAHPAGTIGEDPRGVPTNLFPLLARVAAGRQARLPVHGADWPTPDGTALRDYVHVVDLARGHSAALAFLRAGEGRAGGSLAINLGRGHGTSVYRAVAAFSAAAQRPIDCEVAARRPGDVAVCCADPSRAARLLGWRAARSLAEMCRDHWAWHCTKSGGLTAGAADAADDARSPAPTARSPASGLA